MKVIVVGAGLAGLACARELVRGQAEVLVLEASDDVGGKVRTDTVDGFRIDRGFQVLFTEYPAARRILDLERLSLRSFDPGALIGRGDRLHVFADPARDPDSLFPALTARIVPIGDMFRAWRLSAELSAKPVGALRDGPDQSAERFLRRRGFSDTFMDAFARPFFGGIFLDRSLNVSAQLFQVYWKMLVEGEAAIPANGMGALPQMLASEIRQSGEIRCGVRVEALAKHGEAIRGVVLAGGETIGADHVVVAASPPETARLTGIATPTGSRGVVTLYIGTRQPIVPGRKLVLNANLNPVVHHLAPLSNVAPDLAPDDWHLFAACLLDAPSGTDQELFAAACTDLRRLFCGVRHSLSVLQDARLVSIVRTPFAQIAQPPGFAGSLAPPDPGIDGLRLAGESCAGSSIDAALSSGEAAALSLLDA